MDPDEEARTQLEDALIQIGEGLGMYSQCVSTDTKTLALYEAPDGGYHTFNFAPIGEDAVFPAEL